MPKTALIIGATGLVGRELTKLLLENPGYSQVKTFSRRSSGIQHPKLKEHLIDFNHPETWQNLVTGDTLFSCLGTTIKQAGTKEAQYKVDYTYQYLFAEAAAKNGIPTYILVSSAGANSGSKIFYSRIKGELEEAVKKLPFKSIYLLRPSLLTGKRENDRTGEKIGYVVLKALNSIGLFAKYRPISGRQVAKAMINAAKQANPGIHTYELKEVFSLAN